MSRAKKKLSYISVPSQIVNSLSFSSLHPLLVSPKKVSPKTSRRSLACGLSPASPRLWFLTLFVVAMFGMVRLGYNLDPIVPVSPYPCATATWSKVQALIPRKFSKKQPAQGGLDRQKLALASSGFSMNWKRIKSKVMDDDPGNGQPDGETIGIHRKSQAQARDQFPGARLHIEKKGEETNNEERNSGREFNGITSKLQLQLQLQQTRVPREFSRLPAEPSDDEGSSGDDFWEQPDGMGYRGCLDFSPEYGRGTEPIMKDRRKYLLVVAAGGLNQQRNQIVDAVVIARILGAALVVPTLQVNVIWGDESEFSDIFDLEHFKRALADDLRVVSSLPSKHLRTRPLVDKLTPADISPDWIRSRYLKKLDRVGVLLLRGLDSRLSKDLPSDLQKLRCKVAFQALRFAPGILEMGNRLAERMRSKGPYLALHLRMERDVWVRTGCLPGLSRKFEQLISLERQRHPELLTARSNMTYQDRKLAGLCPLNALEVTRLLKALGAPKNARIYWAGGQPLGGKEALLPLIREFPNFFNKEDIALPAELEPFENRASVMAAIDYIICEKSDVFMPSHGGNMGHALQGQRAYAGHKKYITPNKRQMLHYFMNTSLPEPEFNRIMRALHRDSLGQPDLKIGKLGRDVTKFPIPECMCNSSRSTAHSIS